MEKIYFIVVDNEQAGPYSIEELQNLKIKKDSLVWKDGLENWIEAESIEELKHIFIATPPPIPKAKEPEVVLKTIEPLQFEDNLKKEKLEKQKIKAEITKKKTAKEIKRTMKFFKFSLLIGVLAFLISFAVYNGFKFLPYYFEYENDAKAKRVITNVQSKDDYETKDDDEYVKVAKLTGLDFDLSNSYWFFNFDDGRSEKGEMYSDWTYQSRYTYNQSIYDYDQQIIAFGHYEYEDLKGNPVKKTYSEKIKYHDKKNGWWSYDKNYLKFNDEINKGNIKQKTIIERIEITIEYGRIIHRNVEYAFEYAFYWGIGFLALVFPGIYLISLLFIGVKKSKDWVEKNSQDN